MKISFRDLIQQSHYKYWDFSDYTTRAVLSVLLFCMFKAVVCVELNFFGLIFRFDLPRDRLFKEQFFVSVSINTVCTSLYKSGICRFVWLCYVAVYVTGRRWRCKLKRCQKFLLSRKVNDAGHVEIIISHFFTRTGDAFAVLSCSRQLH